MDNQQATGNLELAWLGGFMDGEGCFSLFRRPRKNGVKNLKPACVISNADTRGIERVHEILEAHRIGHYVEWRKPTDQVFYVDGRPGTRRHQMGQINIFGYKRVQKFCELLLPYLVVKKDQAQTMLDYVNYRLSQGSHYTSIAKRRATSYSEVDWQYYEKMKILKIPAAPETARRTQRHGNVTDGYTEWQEAEVVKIQSEPV